MGATWTAFTTGVANATGKNLLLIQNATGSGVVIALRRLCLSNVQTGSVSGGNGLLILGRYTGVYSAGTGLTFVTMDTNNTALPAGVTVNTNGTMALSLEVFRQQTIFTDELGASDATGDFLNAVPKFSVVWDSGYTESDIQPLTIREGEGITLRAGVAPWNLLGSFSIFAEIEVL